LTPTHAAARRSYDDHFDHFYICTEKSHYSEAQLRRRLQESEKRLEVLQEQRLQDIKSHETLMRDAERELRYHLFILREMIMLFTQMIKLRAFFEGNKMI